MAYRGGCHCGAVTFEVQAELPGAAIECNCSHCRIKGLLLTFHSADQVSWSGADATADYRFNTHKLRHVFCRTCGAQPFAEGAAPDGTATMAINLRCVPACDLTLLHRQPVDGASA
jgi:hypothetical protein